MRLRKPTYVGKKKKGYCRHFDFPERVGILVSFLDGWYFPMFDSGSLYFTYLVGKGEIILGHAESYFAVAFLVKKRDFSLSRGKLKSDFYFGFNIGV